ncbi:hypothetical protein J1N35_028832 [Gossypium stocksii]|uniref:Uncharacterized protein n=1 Tax=Gossypium stocksii TaxID=47602 RepID=A0A9D3UX43_9ROSI|nr:hypothetical protein J1N35_028832 [Gossypium stocksii]
MKKEMCGPPVQIGLARVAHTAWPRNPHVCVGYLYGPTHPTWPSLYGSQGHTSATTRPCLAHVHAFIDHTVVSSHTTNYTSDHMPMWHRQCSFLAIAEASFSAFRIHTWFV